MLGSSSFQVKSLVKPESGFLKTVILGMSSKGGENPELRIFKGPQCNRFF